MNALRIRALALSTALAAGALAGAQQAPSGPAESPTGGLALVQRLDAQVPLDTPLTNEKGESVVLADYFGKKPVVLMLIFYRCAGSCALEFESMAASLKAFKKEQVGRDFDVVAVSIHPKETAELAMAKKQELVERLQRYQPGIAEGLHCLNGEYEPVRKLAESVGFQYVWDPVKEIVRHPAGIMVLTPAGRVSRYFYGVEFPAKPLSDAIGAAAENVIGERTEEFLLGCIQYDPNSGKYSMNIRRALSFSAALTVVVLIASMIVMSRSHRRALKAGRFEAAEDSKD